MMNNIISSMLILSTMVNAYSQVDEYGIVVYAATAAGTVAAIAAAEKGISILLIEPENNVGGMVTGGLSHNDYGDRTMIGGTALEFYRKVADHYNMPIYYWRGPEPHVGKRIFRQWLNEADVSLIFGKHLLEVHKKEGQIKEIVLSDESIVRGKVFIDASYEAEADKAVQGYGFRLIVTDEEGNKEPISKPEGYDPSYFELIKRYYEVHPGAGNMVHLWPTLPNGKTDMNSSGPISTNVVNGLNWEYPEADFDRKQKIWQEIKVYTEGLLYFLSNDLSVPEHIRRDRSG
jgi:hypothetical protein